MTSEAEKSCTHKGFSPAHAARWSDWHYFVNITVAVVHRRMNIV